MRFPWGKKGFDIGWDDLVAHGEGLLLVLLPDQVEHGLDWGLRRLAATFPGRCYLSLNRRFRPNDDMRLRAMQRMADAGALCSANTAGSCRSTAMPPTRS